MVTELVGRDHRRDQEPQPLGAQPGEALRRAHRGPPHRRVRLLGGARQSGHVAVGEERRLLADLLLGPDPPDRADGLAVPVDAFVHVHAQRVELVRQVRPGEPHVEPAATDRVPLRGFRRQLDRVVEDGEDASSDEPDRARPSGHRGEETQRAGAVATVVVEIVLGHLHRIQTTRLRLDRQLQRVTEIVLRRFRLRRAVRKKRKPEAHRYHTPYNSRISTR